MILVSTAFLTPIANQNEGSSAESQSHTFLLLHLFKPSAHRRIMNSQMCCNLVEAISRVSVVVGDDLGEGVKKQLAVGVGEKDFLAGVASAGQMVNRTGKLQAKRSGHGSLLSTQVCYCKT